MYYFLEYYIKIECNEPFFGNFITIERFKGPNKNMLVLCEVRLFADLKSGKIDLQRMFINNGNWVLIEY